MVVNLPLKSPRRLRLIFGPLYTFQVYCIDSLTWVLYFSTHKNYQIPLNLIPLTNT